jgi:hypothetical protein
MRGRGRLLKWPLAAITFVPIATRLSVGSPLIRNSHDSATGCSFATFAPALVTSSSTVNQQANFVNSVCAQRFGRGDLGRDDSFGIARAATVDEIIVFI